MRIISRSALKAFWEINTDAEQPLKAWFRAASKADWATPQDVTRTYGSASVVSDNRVVFNIAGNKYRLIVKFNYAYRVGYVRFVGTHAQYDEVDAGAV